MSQKILNFIRYSWNLLPCIGFYLFEIASEKNYNETCLKWPKTVSKRPFMNILIMDDGG